MGKNKRKPELVVPAGNVEKLKVALKYGADAVYLGGESFSLRAKAGNFSVTQLAEALDFAHHNKKRVYLTLNSFLYEKDIPVLKNYLTKLKGLHFDAVIVSDPGMLTLLKTDLPKLSIHLSTQTNTMNRYSAQFWFRNGIKRIILARELSIPEITSLTRESKTETEVFVHGAACLSFSGRCYLSKYMTDRDANLGDCAQNCRWRYYLVEEKRPDEYYPVVEDSGLSYILNTKDICSIKILSDLVCTGVHAFKIEGRMKSAYYLAIVTRIYREALDSCFSDAHYKVKKEWIDELEMISHRPYNYSPYSGAKNDLAQDLSRCREQGVFIALVKEKLPNEYLGISVRNCLRKGEIIDIISPHIITETQIEDIRDTEGNSVELAHPNHEVTIKLSHKAEPYWILRRKKKAASS